MEKNFKLLNDVGIEVNYTLLGVMKSDKNYVVYTNYLPADNEFGIRILVGELISEEPLNIKRLSLAKQKEIANLFIKEMIMNGRTIRKDN